MTEKRLIFEMSAIDFVEWLNKNRFYIAFVSAIINKEVYKKDNENDNMLYPCTSENMANEFAQLLNELNDENKELKEINQDHQDHISLLEEEKINLQIKLQKIRDYAMENGEVKQGVIEKVVFE